MKYEIPKEIKSNPKILGLEMKELVIILISSLLLLTILRELVHNLFSIFYFGVAIVSMVYLFLPSGSNPSKRNYEAILLMFRHKRGTYHAVSQDVMENPILQQTTEGEKPIETIQGHRVKPTKAG